MHANNVGISSEAIKRGNARAKVERRHTWGELGVKAKSMRQRKRAYKGP